MKKLILAFSLFFCLSNLLAQEWQLQPKQPQSGDKMTIQYHPNGGELEGMEVYAIAYVFEMGQAVVAHDVPLVNAGNGYTGDFQAPDQAQLVLFRFENERGDKVDNNKEQGYYTYLYNGDQIAPHSYALAAGIYGEHADLIGIETDGAKSAELLKKGTENPSDRLSKDHLKCYAVAVRLTKDEEGKSEIIQHLKSTLAKGQLTEKEMSKMANIANIVRDKALSDTIKEQIKSDFPKGKSAIRAKYAKFRKLDSLEDQLAMYEEAYSNYKDNEDFKSILDNMERSLAISYGEKNDFENMYQYAERLSSAKSKAGIYNKIAWECSGESIEGEGHHLKEGLEMSMKSLNVLEQNMETMKGKPKGYSARQWKRGLESYIAYYGDTYALLAYKNGDPKTALHYQKIACEAQQMGDAEMNARYAVFIEEAQGATEAMAFVEEMILKGGADAKMKAQFARLFKANVSLEQAYSMYMEKLEESALAHKIESIKEEMISEKAPSFALKNLDGTEVHLEKLKGKIVVVDFWATWCGPCKASFPGMQEAVNKYRESDDVAFLFVDTWESAKNKEENARKFMDSKGYTFNVLMDNDNSMVSEYGVNGIPTKFIIDKEGNIRFRSTGFNGSNEVLVEEISIVVDILRGSGDAGNPTGAQP
ncbi:MAG: TlpA disulfide reductase family protein [Bacteroidota bacterium]